MWSRGVPDYSFGAWRRIAETLPFCVILAGACATGNRYGQPHQNTELKHRDPLVARSLNEKGLRRLEDDDLEGAEKKFRESLENDLYYAPAHNNLGLVLLQQEHHYEAALELDFARRLMPQAAEPRSNLGVLYEKLGRLEKACEEYEAALAVHPDSLAVMRHLARAYVKINKDRDKLAKLLDRILLTPDSGAWDLWARGQLIRIGRSGTDSASGVD